MEKDKQSLKSVLYRLESGRIDKSNKISGTSDKKELIFLSDDYRSLCKNEYFRFVPNSDVIGNTVVFFDGKQVVAHQFEMPKSKGAPTWKPLKNITPINRFGKQVYQAQTLEGNTVYASRSYTFTDQSNKRYTLLPFSLPPTSKNEPLWKNKELVPITKVSVVLSKSYIGGRELEVDSNSVAIRSATIRRKPDQNTVMGLSAKDAYEFFYKEMADKLTPEMRKLFERAIHANIRDTVESNFRPEWLHAEGYSLTPTWIDPQRKDNLGSGPKWANTTMMVLERIAKWYALHCQDSYVSIKPTFEMLFNTRLIKTIDFEVRVGFKEHFLRFIQHIEPLRRRNPVFPVASDIAQLTGVSHAILTNKKPAVVSVLAQGNSVAKWCSFFNTNKNENTSKRTVNIKSIEKKETDSPGKNAKIGKMTSGLNTINARSRKIGLFVSTNHSFNSNSTLVGACSKS